jgi:hypothetical protein
MICVHWGIVAVVHLMEGKMHKIWFAVAFAVLMAKPASAQDYRRNFAECIKELGLQSNPSYVQRLQSEPGRVLRGFQLQSEAQQAVLNDCAARKAGAARKPQ